MATGWPMKVTYANGDVYSASDVNDITGTINLLTSTTLSYQAGKNRIINGGMDIWQRGTSIALAASTSYTSAYNADRFTMPTNASQACTVSRQATGDTTNLPNIQYCARVQRNSGQTGTGQLNFGQPLETVNSVPLAGQAVTLSFYARKGANYSATSNALGVTLLSGTGTDQTAWSGYTGSATVISQTATLTSTWQRFTYTATVSTTSTELTAYYSFSPTGTASTNDYFEITGVQLELGSYATTFSRAGGTIQGELAACQRYYQFVGGTANGFPMATFYNSASSQTNRVPISFPVQMRTAPTITKNGTWAGNAGQPSAGYISSAGFSFMFDSTGGGMNYSYPDSTDDTLTISAEL